VFRIVVGVAANVLIFGALLFGPAGTLHWWRAWVYLGVVAIVTLASSVVIMRVNPGVLDERFRAPIQKDQPLEDKIVLVLFLAAFIGYIAFIPLDVFRWRLLGRPGPLASSLGLALVLVGWSIVTLAMAENAFAAPVVKHRFERRQRVVDTGVYGVVRHPMYAGVIPLLVGTALWLESGAAAVLAIVPVALLAVRIVIEERFLRRELEGYDAYTERVRYRLIPLVW